MSRKTPGLALPGPANIKILSVWVTFAPVLFRAKVGDVEVSIGPKGQIFRPAKVGVDCITGEHVYKRKKRLGIVTRNLAFEVSLHWSI